MWGWQWFTNNLSPNPSSTTGAWSEAKKAKRQALIEKLRASWPMDRDYMAPLTRGTLARLDPALLVIPLKGRESG